MINFTNKFAIFFHKNKEDIDGGLLKLDGAGIIEQTENAFEAKLMPSKDHAIQLAQSVLPLDTFYIEIVELYAEWIQTWTIKANGGFLD